MNTLSAGNVSRNRSSPPCRRLAPRCVAVALTLCINACTIGPNYRTPSVQVPESFKEGTDWQRAHANPQGSLSSVWWREYHDDRLTHLVEQSQEANQSIVAAEAAYQLALAIVQVNTASLFPIVTANASGSRTGTSANAASTAGNARVGSTVAGVRNDVSVSVAASWEIDLWGAIRREIESAKENAQATDAQLVGERLSIAASVAVDYFRLRQADIDIQSLKQQQDIDARILEMTRATFLQGEASNDQVLAAQDTLELVVADLQVTETAREQDEHAIAVLTGVPPADFMLPPDPSYAFVLPDVPLALPSQLLERRYDVVSAERTAASANARIGVAEAAFFPTLTLSAQGGFQHNTFAHLFSLPNRVWTLGPDLAATIFDGGARTAAVREARAIYDEDAAIYRNTVLTAFESVEDSLSSVSHLREQTQAFANIFQRNRQLFASEAAQQVAGAASEQQLLTQQLTLIQAEQNLRDTQALLTQGSVTLIRNLGGGWQWGDKPGGGRSSTSSGKDVSFSGKPNLQEAPTPAPD